MKEGTITIGTRADGAVTVALPWLKQGNRAYFSVIDCRNWLKANGFVWDRAAKAWIGTEAELKLTRERIVGRARPYLVVVDGEPPVAEEQPATERQIAYASKLLSGLTDSDWHDADVPGRKPTEAELRTMTRSQVSAVIDSARDMRG